MRTAEVDMTNEQKLELLARLLPYVSDDDSELPLAEFAVLVSERCWDDVTGDNHDH